MLLFGSAFKGLSRITTNLFKFKFLVVFIVPWVPEVFSRHAFARTQDRKYKTRAIKASGSQGILPVA